MARWQIVLDVEDGEIIGVEGPNGPGTPVTLSDRKKYKKSLYGLRTVDTLYDYDSKHESVEVAAPRRCFMVIGGFKVEVPCS
jgi:hypothetical protein